MRRSMMVILIIGSSLVCGAEAMVQYYPLPIRLEKDFGDAHKASVRAADEWLLRAAQNAAGLRFGTGNYQMRYHDNMYERGGFYSQARANELVGYVPVQTDYDNFLYVVHFTRTPAGIHSRGLWQAHPATQTDNAPAP